MSLCAPYITQQVTVLTMPVGYHFKIIFNRDSSNNRAWGRTLDGILIDGTIKYCPTFFMQLYTIHGTVNGQYMPLVHCLSPNETQDTYRKMLTVLYLCIRPEFFY